MIIKKYSFYLTIIFNLIFGYYGPGLSISESDNNDAIYFNPAGLAIDHGVQFDLFGNTEQNSNDFYTSFKTKNFGFSYKNIDDQTGFRIGLADKIHKNLYYGYVWDNKNLLDVGILYRPSNFISLAWKSTLKDDFSEFITYEFGLGIRPLGCKSLTIGADYHFDAKWNSNKTSLFIKTIPLKGLELSASISSNEYEDNGMPIFNFENLESHNLKLNIGLNFDGIKSTYSEIINGQKIIGTTFTSHKEPNLFDKKKDKYVTLVFDDIFIEEKPKKRSFNIRNIFNSSKNGVQLRSWIEKIDKLSKDQDVQGLIIHLKNISGGFSKRIEIRDALIRFKNSGKKIILYSENTISNMNYHIASIADEIYVNPLTGVDLKGLSMEVTFYKGLLDTLKIEPAIWRIEDKDGNSYKTAGDPFKYTNMSNEMRENYGQLLDDLNEVFIKDIALARGWINEDKTPDIEYTKTIINEGPYWEPEIAMERGLIDGIFYPDEFKKYVKDSIVNKSKIIKFANIGKNKDYNYDWKEYEKPKIAIIYAVGGIMPGKSNPGPQGSSVMGDKTIKESIQQARNDKNIEAIILRIDSGGGSAVASDQMWREIYKTTHDSINRKPFIASMSSAAASGGYYIACEADTIIAQSTTITGSIGVISIGFNLNELYNKIGINKEVLKRGEFSDFLTQSREWNEEEHEKMRKSTEYFYREFKDRVLEGRQNLNSEELDELALGRVWSGNTAFKNGLIDEVGGINKTIKIAKQMAGISEQEIEIVEFPNTIKNKFNKNDKKSLEYYELIMELLPKSIQKELNQLNIIPLLKDEKIYFMVPYHIEIN
tara:strand:- start:1516 stop:3981 length:2466 start_codon:yes stop_codon:yes gene_type:complete